MKKVLRGGVSITVRLSIFTAIILFILSLSGVGSLFLFFKLRFEGVESREVMELSFTKTTKNLLREQRHDYMNIFQIIYGYLQLNNKDMAIEHIKKAINSSSNSSKCFYLSVFSISLLLEKMIKVCENKGIEIVYDVDSCVNSDIRHINEENVVVDCISKLFEIFIDCTQKNADGAKLFIDIYEDVDKMEFIFNGNIDEKLLEHRSKEVNNIKKIDDGYEAVFYFDKIKDLLKEDSIYSISNSY